MFDDFYGFGDGCGGFGGTGLLLAALLLRNNRDRGCDDFHARSSPLWNRAPVQPVCYPNPYACPGPFGPRPYPYPGLGFPGYY